MKFRLRKIISLLMICTLILSANRVNAATEDQGTIVITDLSVTNPNYYGGFTIAKDSSKKISIGVTPKKATNKTLAWKSSDESIVKVSDKGIIQGIKNGEANIIVVTTDGSNLTETIPITVGVPVKKITSSAKKVTIIEGETAKVTMKASPSNASKPELILRSSNEAIATISKDGVITGVTEGKTSIYAVTKDGTNRRTTVVVTVTGTTVSRTLTDEDVVDGKIELSNIKLRNLTIESSVGDAEIILDQVTVRGDLKMENGANYSVFAKDCKINNVIALEENTNTNTNAISSFALNPEGDDTKEAPTFIAEKGTLVVNIDARGNVSVRQENSAVIGTVTVSRNMNGNLEVKLEGFDGNLVVNTASNADINIITNSCNIAEATISGANAGQSLSIQEETTGGSKSTINKINIDTNAEVKVDVPTKELVIPSTVNAANVKVEKPVEKIVNEGKGTELKVNNNVGSIESTGEKLVMKLSAGSEVKEVTSQGSGSQIDVALGSKISNIVSSGADTQIGGSGTIDSVEVQGNNTVINNDKAKVTVDQNVQGTKANGTEISGGNSTGGSTSTNPPAPPAPPATTPTVTVSPTEVPVDTVTPTEKPVDTVTPTEKPVDTVTPTEKPVDTVTPTEKPAVTVTPTEKPEQPTVGPSSTPAVTVTPTKTPPQTGTVITISNPGRIIAGQNVQLAADMENISWSVYNHIDKTSGEAMIDTSTGMLTPINGGTIRIVATSNLNDEVYGAVDVTINSKKFVRMNPLVTVTINQDMNLSCITELEKNNLLPKTVELVYETGMGTETEIVTVDLYNNWYGSYSGDTEGTYMLHNYINIGGAYERPDNLVATVCIQLEEAQTDLRKEIISVAELPDIVLDTDEKLIKFYQVYSKYFGEKQVQVTCSDGTHLSCTINGWYGGGTDEFNGAVAGTYEVLLAAPVPEGYVYNKVNIHENNVNWNEWESIDVPVTITVQVPQTPIPYIEPVITPTTQQKFISDNTKAIIDSVEIIGAPSIVKAGEIIDFSQYLKVNTASNLDSDQRVVWTLNGYNSGINSITGYALMNYGYDIRITATSVIDKSKSVTIIVSVTNSQINSFEAFEPIVVNEDKNIVGFNSMYDKLKSLLPRYIYAEMEGEQIRLKIQGWYMDYKTPKEMGIRPLFNLPISYQWNLAPILTITLAVPQTDNRIKVTSGTPVVAEYTLNEDKYAVGSKPLFYATVGENTLVPVTAVLENGEEEVLQCRVVSWYQISSYSPIGYQGTTGDVTYLLELKYPEGYVALYPFSDQVDISAQITVHVTVEQTSKYEMIWVTQQPKLTYHVGDSLDLSEMIVRVRDSYSSEVLTYSYLGITKFAERGLELRLNHPNGELVEQGKLITGDLNGRYIYVKNKNNGEFAPFGPIKVEPIELTFEPFIVSNGAINALYYNTVELAALQLPRTLMSREGIEVPVVYWYSQPDTSDFGKKAASYTFTAQLLMPPMGYTIAEDTVVTAVVTIAETLSIEWIEQFEDIVVPLSYQPMPITLPDRIGVRLSDGVTSNHWLPVVWDQSSYNPSIAGEYVITGSITSSNLINDQNLVPTVKVVVTKPDSVALVDLEIINLPDKLLYKQGEALNLDGLKVIGKYSDGSTLDITSDITAQAVSGSAISVVSGSAVEAVSGGAITGFDNTEVGLKHVIITYRGVSSGFNVYVDSSTVEDYTLLFITDNNFMYPINVPKGRAVEVIIPIPLKMGFVFQGWSSMGMVVDRTTIPSSDMVAYATWSSLEVRDNGIHGYGALPAHEYELYADGERINLVSVTEPWAKVIDGKLYIDLYDSQSGRYSYLASDDIGRMFSFEIEIQSPYVLTVTNYHTVETVEGKPCWKYSVSLYNPEFAPIYNYSDEFEIHGTYDGTDLYLYVPTEIDPGTYKFMIELNEEFYKIEIVI